MSENKKGAYFLLTNDTKIKIETLAGERKTSQAEALSYMVDEYFKDRKVEHKILVETMSELIDEKLYNLKEDLKRVRLTSNVIDREMKMSLEFWNHYFVVNDFKQLVTTEKYRTNELKEADELIRKRISNYRQLKLEQQKEST